MSTPASKPLRILLLGGNGQVGWELRRALAPLGEVVAPGRAPGQGASDELGADLSRPDELASTVRRLRPDVIVNSAAHTAVDKAEGEAALAETVNAASPALLAREAAALGAWLVHYSTDYVFDGSGTEARKETDTTGPLNVYGRTKLAGEQAIRHSGCKHLIFRTSWVYAARGGNFAKTMLRLAQERDKLKVIDDQVGAPTGAELIADVTAHALRTVLAGRRTGKRASDAADADALSGLYHLVAGGETSWHGYARYVIEKARAAGQAIKVAASDIEAVPTSAFPTPAQRPLNSRLCTDVLQSRFGLHLPHWQVGVERLLNEILVALPASSNSGNKA